MSYRPFWEKCTKWPQNNRKPSKVKCTPYMCYEYPLVQVHSVSLCNELFFWVTGHLEKSAPNDPNITLNTHTSSKVPHMCYLCPWFPNFTLFCSTASHFWYRSFWDKCTQWPQNDLEPYKVKCTPYMYNYCPWVSNFTVSLCDQLFLRYRPFWDQCNSIYVLLLFTTNSKFHSISLYDQPFSSYRPFWDKCTKWPQIDLEPYKVKVLHICISSVPDFQISLCFAVRPAVFKISYIL